MNKRIKPVPIPLIKQQSEKYIKWMCFNLLISTDNQVFNLLFKPMKEQLIGGSYCFYCNGKYRTKKYIKENCLEVLGFITP